MSLREKSSASASIADGELCEMMMLGLGIGGACSLRGEDGRAGRMVEEETGRGRSARSRGFDALKAQSWRINDRIRDRENRRGTYAACLRWNATNLSARSVGCAGSRSRFAFREARAGLGLGDSCMLAGRLSVRCLPDACERAGCRGGERKREGGNECCESAPEEIARPEPADNCAAKHPLRTDRDRLLVTTGPPSRRAWHIGHTRLRMPAVRDSVPVSACKSCAPTRLRLSLHNLPHISTVSTSWHPSPTAPRASSTPNTSLTSCSLFEPIIHGLTRHAFARSLAAHALRSLHLPRYLSVSSPIPRSSDAFCQAHSP